MRSPAIRLLIDEDVPQAVLEFLRGRGHDVQLAREPPLASADDEAVARAASAVQAIVVTWNHRHYSQLISRVPPLNYLRFPHAGRISFVCPHSMGAKRVREVIADIEHEYLVVQARRDRRLIMVVGDTWFRIDR